MNCADRDITAVEDALDHLCLLGGADGIAAHLTRHGHTGKRRELCACPVAAYLLARTGRRVEIAEQRWGFAGGAMDEGWVRPPVAEFIRAFDDGRYPQLVASDETAEVA